MLCYSFPTIEKGLPMNYIRDYLVVVVGLGYITLTPIFIWARKGRR